MLNVEQKEFYTVFSNRMAGYLMQKGFVLLGVFPHRYQPGRNVYRFCDTPALHDAIDQYQIDKCNFEQKQSTI